GHTGRRRHAGAIPLGEPPHHVAYLCHVCGLRHYLHHYPETPYTTEHRNWRAVRRHAACIGLGGRGKLRARGSVDSGSHYLYLDTAAFLGTGLVPQYRLRAVGPAHAAGYPRPTVHALA